MSRVHLDLLNQPRWTDDCDGSRKSVWVIILVDADAETTAAVPSQGLCPQLGDSLPQLVLIRTDDRLILEVLLERQIVQLPIDTNVSTDQLDMSSRIQPL